MRACNTCGWGAWSEPLPCTTAPDVPAAPAGLAAKAVGTSVRATWEPAEDHGSPLLAYELQAAGGGGGSSGAFAPAYRGEACHHKLTSLQANAAYQLRVRAVNAGEGGGGAGSPGLGRGLLSRGQS